MCWSEAGNARPRLRPVEGEGFETVRRADEGPRDRYGEIVL